jgi:hypothetical protein
MGGLFLIVPVVAFDIWLSCTTGNRHFRQWAGNGQWRPAIYVLGLGLVLAILLTFFVRYGWGPGQRVQGFPIPLVFFHQDGKTWTRTTLPGGMQYVGSAADFLTGLVAPLIPYKVAEFIKVVKAELK